MPEISATAILLASFSIGIMGAFVGWWFEWRVLRRLERAHPEVIRHFDESWGPTSTFLSRFIWRKQYRDLGDPSLVALVNRTRIVWIGTASCVFAGWSAFQLLN